MVLERAEKVGQANLFALVGIIFNRFELVTIILDEYLHLVADDDVEFVYRNSILKRKKAIYS